MFFKESCFRDSWQTLSVVPVLRTIGERSVAQHHGPICLLSAVSKIYEVGK